MNPTTNYGSESRLVSYNSPVNDLLLRFAVTGTGGCRIPSARLRLTIGSGTGDKSPHGGDFHGAADSSWSQGTVTWSTAPAAGSTTVASLGSVALGASYTVDVTPLVTGDGPVTIRVTTTSGDASRYYSREGATTAGQAPQLQVACG